MAVASTGRAVRWRSGHWSGRRRQPVGGGDVHRRAVQWGQQTTMDGLDQTIQASVVAFVAGRYSGLVRRQRLAGECGGVTGYSGG
ncbi:hypothetical protein ACLOJK_022578 [Asimina triloba]